MGWKASCILINGRGPGYLGTMPPYDPELARRLITDLGLGPSRSRGMTTFDYGIYPDHLVVGAYEMAPNAGWVAVPLEPFEENAAANVRDRKSVV